MLDDSTLPDEPGAVHAADTDSATAVPGTEAEPSAAAVPEIAAEAAPELSPAATAARLAELFPAVFTPHAPKPLKLRIQTDIQERALGVFTKKMLSPFLHRHTTSTGYLKALVNAPHRVDLDGAPAGDVAAEHREAAVAELQRRRELHEARRAAERDAQRASQRAAYDEARRAQLAEDTQRRERDALLRAYETSTLTRANFCALKGLSEAELDSLIEQGRQAPAPRPAEPRAVERDARPRPAKFPRNRPPQANKPAR